MDISSSKNWREVSLANQKNKPGTAQVGAISKAQKQQKDLKVSKYSLLRHPKKTQKLNRIGAPEGTLLDFSSILSKIVKKLEGHFWWKKIWKKSLNAQKTESQCRKKVMSELWKRYIRTSEL